MCLPAPLFPRQRKWLGGRESGREREKELPPSPASPGSPQTQAGWEVAHLLPVPLGSAGPRGGRGGGSSVPPGCGRVMCLFLQKKSTCFSLRPSWGGALFLCLSRGGEGVRLSFLQGLSLCSLGRYARICCSLRQRILLLRLSVPKERAIDPPWEGRLSTYSWGGRLFCPGFPVGRRHFCIYPRGPPVTWAGVQFSYVDSPKAGLPGWGPFHLMCLDESKDSQHPACRPARPPAGSQLGTAPC